MNRFCALGLFLLAAAAAAATAQQPDSPEAGWNPGDYNVRQSIELGARVVDIGGNGSVYDTFVDQHSGMRILRQDLEMNSHDHHGLLFDRLSLHSFGFGGEPNTAARLRMGKDRWYDLRAEFRRDRSPWDFNLLANPLNPPGSVPAILLISSPHRMDTVRRMSDVSVKLAPRSSVSLRLGYSRNVHDGPAFSTLHLGIPSTGLETMLSAPMRSLTDTYFVGWDVKALPRTTISFDQVLPFYRNDSFRQDKNFVFQLANGTPVDLGIVFNDAFATCGPLLDPGNPQFANPFCNGVTGYSRFGPQRSRYPESRLSAQSDYFRRWNLNARASYSSGRNRMPAYTESFDGFLTPSNERKFTTTADSDSRRVLAAADLGATWEGNDHVSVHETFRFTGLRVPGSTHSVQNELFGDSLLTPPNMFAPANCPPPFVAATCPHHSFLSAADVDTSTVNSYLGEETESNQLQLELSANEHFGVNVGHRFRRREITTRLDMADALSFFPDQPNRGACFAGPLDAQGVCQVRVSSSGDSKVTIHENSLLLGAWFRAQDHWRGNFDLEWRNADNAYTRLDPRAWQQYRARVSYAANEKLNFTASGNFTSARNSQSEERHRDHNRNANLTALFTPARAWELELGYDYLSVHAETNICFSSSALPASAAPCTLGVFLFEEEALYNSRSHSAFGRVAWHPVERFRAELGYYGNSDNGDALFTDPLSVPGTLRYNFHQPWASVEIGLAKGWTLRQRYNYYGYNEKAPSGPSPARDFRANVFLTSLRYSF
jgi:hypothetical protein